MQIEKLLRYIFIIYIFISLAFFVQLVAEEGDAGTESNFKLGFGARALGLGNAFTALADDPTAVFWNPAGLEYIYQQSATVFHTSLWGTNYDFIGYAYPTINLGTFGVGIGRIGVGDIPQTDAQGAPYENSFSNEEIQVYMSYAKRLPLNMNITPGITIRYVRRGWSGLQGIEDLASTGIGADIGVMYKPDWFGSFWLQDWSFGLKVHNILAPQLKEGTLIDKLPLTTKLGFLKKVRFKGGEYFNVLFDFDYSEKRAMKVRIGTEYRFRDIGDVRFGLSDVGMSFGASFEYNMFQIDYAYGYNSYADFFPAVHRISLSVHFGLTRDELYEIAEAERLAEEEQIIIERIEANRQKFIADHLKIADNYCNSGQYMDAMVEYRQVLTNDSSNTYAQMKLDSTNILLQESFNAMQARAVREALDKNRAESDRNFINEHFEKGRQYLNRNKFQEALFEFNLTLERDKSNQALISAISTARRRVSEETERLIRQSREELNNQNYSDAQLLLADARTLSEDNPAQLQEIDTLTQQVNLQKKIQSGVLLYQISEFDKALILFEDAFSIDPENEMVKDYLEKCKLETIVEDTKMDAEINKRYLRGMDEYLRGNYSTAVAIWDSILLEQPYNKKVISALQGVKERLKRNSR